VPTLDGEGRNGVCIGFDCSSQSHTYVGLVTLDEQVSVAAAAYLTSPLCWME